MLIIISLFLCGCTKEEDKVGNAHLNVVQGKVIEVMNENKVMIEMTKDRGGYKKGEHLIIVFRELTSVGNYKNLTDYEVQLDDEATAQFASIDGEMDSCDYVEVKYLGIICEEESTVQ